MPTLRSGSVGEVGNAGKLHYLIKLPQAGGSSFANNWCREGTYPRVVLGGDDFRLAVYQAEYSRQGEGLVFGIMDACARAMLSRGFDVLIDETSTTEQTLLRYYLIDPEAQPIILDTSEEECIRRALASGKEYLVEPIRMMARQKEELLRDWPAAVERVRQKIRTRYPNTKILVNP